MTTVQQPGEEGFVIAWRGVWGGGSHAIWGGERYLNVIVHLLPPLVAGTTTGRSNHASADKQQLCPPAVSGVAPKAAAVVPFSASLLTTAGQPTTAGKLFKLHIYSIAIVSACDNNRAFRFVLTCF